MLCPPIGLRDLDIPDGYINGATIDKEAELVELSTANLPGRSKEIAVEISGKFPHWAPFATRSNNIVSKLFKFVPIIRPLSMNDATRVINNGAANAGNAGKNKRKAGSSSSSSLPNDISGKNDTNDEDKHSYKFSSGRHYSLKLMNAEIGDSNFYTKVIYYFIYLLLCNIYFLYLLYISVYLSIYLPI